MLSHFDKLSTPPRSVHQYSTVESQRSRFLTRGWQSANIWDLWEAWTGDDFLAETEREFLDEIEPFDEWEEFMLFGRHYFVLHATATLPIHPPPETTRILNDDIPVYQINFRSGAAKKATKRRFGNSVRFHDPWGRNYGLHLWGWVVDGRANNCDLYSLTSGASSYELPLSGPGPRMCSTLTDLGDLGVLLVCGRASPAKPLSDCWLLQKGPSLAWKRTWDFPSPVFRHSAIRLRGTSLVLVSGGKKDSSMVSADSYIFEPKRGWLKCSLSGPEPEYVFGAVLCNTSRTATEIGVFEGLLSGGITQRGLVNERVYLWKVDLNNATVSSPHAGFCTVSNVGEQPSISYREIDCGRETPSLAVFGAEVVELANCTAICGGMGASPLFQGRRITFVSVSDSGCEVLGTSFPADDNETWPLIVGASVLCLGSRLLCFGGAATCFSMGSYWNTMPYQLELPTDLSGRQDPTVIHSDILEYLESPRFLDAIGIEGRAVTNKPTKAEIITITRVKSGLNLDFQTILREGKPVVIEATDLGKCIESWSPDYLVERIGKDREVCTVWLNRPT
jgi:tRNA wybutosine-synthesizing protein 4